MLPEHDSNDAYAELTCPECGEEERIEWVNNGRHVRCYSCKHEWDPRDDGYDDSYDHRE